MKMRPHSTLAMQTFWVALGALIALSACGDGDSKSKDSGAMEANEQGGASQEEGGSEPTAGEGDAPTGGTQGGEAGAGGTEEAGLEAGEAPPSPPQFCPAEIMEVQRDQGISLPYPSYVGVDDRFDGKDWRLEVDMRGAARPGVYSLNATTPETCTVCVTLNYNCTQRGCAARLFANEGTVIVDEMGDGGDRLVGSLQEVKFMNLSADGSLSEPSINACIQEQAFDVFLPALIEDTVPSFELQSCETGEFVSLEEKLADQNGLWYIATAGWCPACRIHLGNIHDGMIETLNAGKVRPMFVVTEDDDFAPATLEFCRAYSRRYADSAENFYLDANLATSAKYIQRYTDEDGEWGIPWDNIIEAGTMKLLYSDNAAPPSALQSTLNELMSR